MVNFDNFSNDRCNEGGLEMAMKYDLKMEGKVKESEPIILVSACFNATYEEPKALGWVPLGSANPDGSGRQPMASRKNEGMPLK